MGRQAAKLNPSKISHPNSRKAKQLIRHNHKVAARDKKKLKNFIKLNSFGEKVLWFRDNIDKDVTEYTKNDAASLINKYLSRFNEEIELIESTKKFDNRKYASREDQIRHIISDESREYEGCGLEIPDILDNENLSILRKWNGELRFLQNIKMNRYNRQQLL